MASFLKSMAKDFDPQLALEHLVSDQKLDKFDRDILFSAFCAWMIAPQEPPLVIHAMGLHIIGVGAAYEAKHRVEATTEPRFRSRYREFLGLRMAYKLPSRNELFSIYRDKIAQIEVANKLISIFHYHADELFVKSQFGIPSLFKAAPLISKLMTNGVKARQAMEIWSQYRNSAAFTYAASSTTMASGQSFLSAVTSGFRAFSNNKEKSLEVIARARFISEVVLGKLDRKTAPFAVSQFPAQITAQHFSVQGLSESDKSIITDAFQRKHNAKAKVVQSPTA
jgi:hypothetical protein